jgi:hypothetical protein
VEGVVRVIDNPPAAAQNNKSAQIFSSYQEEYSADRRREVVSVQKNDSPDARVPGELATKGPHPNSTDAPYKVYNIGNSSPVPLMDYIAAIESILGKTAKKEFLPMQPGDVPKTEADVTDLAEDLGYKPDTPVQKGIERFIEWYKSYFEK